MLSIGGLSDVSELTPVEMRHAIDRLSEAVDAKGVPIGKIENRELPRSGHPLKIRIYTPSALDTEEPAGLIYFHGGTGIFSSVETHDGLCRLLANESGCRVISVEYRLAPEHKFPAAVEDSVLATQWVAEHARELAIDPRRIAIGGDSAGGTLAAVACQLAKGAGGPKLALQVLFCPVTDLGAVTKSREAYAKGYFLDRTILEWALGHYCPPGSDLTDPRLSPLRATDLTGLPPAQIHTAEFDPLRDEGKAYAERLERSGVRVQYICHPGMIHHFYGMAGVIPYARLALRSAGAAIKEALTHDLPQ